MTTLLFHLNRIPLSVTVPIGGGKPWELTIVEKPNWEGHRYIIHFTLVPHVDKPIRVTLHCCVGYSYGYDPYYLESIACTTIDFHQFTTIFASLVAFAPHMKDSWRELHKYLAPTLQLHDTDEQWEA